MVGRGVVACSALAMAGVVATLAADLRGAAQGKRDLQSTTILPPTTTALPPSTAAVPPSSSGIPPLSSAVPPPISVSYPVPYAMPQVIDYSDIKLMPRWQKNDDGVWEFKVPIPDWTYQYTFDDPDGTCSHKCTGDMPYYGLDYCHTNFQYYEDNCMDYYHPYYHPWIFTAPISSSSSSSSGGGPVRRDLCGLECMPDEHSEHGHGRYLLSDEGVEYHRELGECPPCPGRRLTSDIGSSAAPPSSSSSAVPVVPLPSSSGSSSSSSYGAGFYNWWEPCWPPEDKMYCHFYYSVCGMTVAYHLAGTGPSSSSSSAVPPPPLYPGYAPSASFYHGPPSSSVSSGGPPLAPGYTHGAGFPPLSSSGAGFPPLSSSSYGGSALPPSSMGAPSSMSTGPTIPSGPTIPTGPTSGGVPPTSGGVPPVTGPTVPTAPTVPSAPTVPTAPTVPSAPTVPTAPTAPTAGTGPTV